VSFEPLYESAKRIIIRSRLVAIMRDLTRMFGCDMSAVHEIIRPELTDDERDPPPS
jgi:hypothetical protein